MAVHIDEMKGYVARLSETRGNDELAGKSDVREERIESLIVYGAPLGDQFVHPDAQPFGEPFSVGLPECEPVAGDSRVITSGMTDSSQRARSSSRPASRWTTPIMTNLFEISGKAMAKG